MTLEHGQRLTQPDAACRYIRTGAGLLNHLLKNRQPLHRSLRSAVLSYDAPEQPSRHGVRFIVSSQSATNDPQEHFRFVIVACPVQEHRLQISKTLPQIGFTGFKCGKNDFLVPSKQGCGMIETTERVEHVQLFRQYPKRKIWAVFAQPGHKIVKLLVELGWRQFQVIAL